MPTTKPSPTASAASDPDSQASQDAAFSQASSAAADPFVADPGAFNAHADDDEPPDLAAAPEPVVELALWTPERVRRLLELQGQLTHAIVGVGEHDWVWLPAELDAVCGALADYANRVPALAAMAHLSDEAAIVAGFTSYALRSWRERVRVLRERAAEPDRPVTGRAPTDDEPDPDAVEWSVQTT